MRLLLLNITLVLGLLFAAGPRGCSFYTTNPLKGGTSEYTDTTKVEVLQFVNNAALAKGTVPQTVAEALRDGIQTQTKLDLVPRGGELVYEGTITNYVITPVNIQGNTQTAALNRLTITVSIKFTDLKKESNSFEASFSRFADYQSTQNLSSVEDDLIREISTQLVQDILNRSLNAW